MVNGQQLPLSEVLPEPSGTGVWPLPLSGVTLAGVSAGRRSPHEGDRGDVSGPQQRCLPVREVPAHRVPTRADQGDPAVEHAMLIEIWHILTNDVFYDDLGDQFYAERSPDKTKQRALDQLRKMGYDVTLNPLQAAG